jgi:ring-1,2-phenylacetyl-CoA epoxidase subunit PaaD
VADSERELTEFDGELERAVRQALEQVSDPEIPALSVVDLGMVQEVRCSGGHVTVRMTPTFVGCPALAIIRKNVEDQLRSVAGVEEVDVEFSFDTIWTTDRISDKGKQKLREFGIAPPACSLANMGALQASCPYCGSDNTRLENLFGPTACRSVFYCEECKQPFEAMKPV